ncbi:hypothetical protein ERO13_A01G109801v2 [Gossypium hirsutum]|nr:hypothetical protein ERO13_A01G109801v2 [Gossypium hirsutum]
MEFIVLSPEIPSPTPISAKETRSSMAHMRRYGCCAGVRRCGVAYEGCVLVVRCCRLGVGGGTGGARTAAAQANS